MSNATRPVSRQPQQTDREEVKPWPYVFPPEVMEEIWAASRNRPKAPKKRRPMRRTRKPGKTEEIRQQPRLF